jgi:hypothetical protein
LVSFSSGYPQSHIWKVYYVLALVLSVGNTILSVFAVCWLGLWFGLRMLGQGRVILWAVLLAKGLPWVLIIAWSLLYRFLVSLVVPYYSSGSPLLFGGLAPQVITLLFYFWLIRLARSQLSYELAGAEPLDLRHILSRTAPWMAAAIQRARQWRAV